METMHRHRRHAVLCVVVEDRTLTAKSVGRGLGEDIAAAGTTGLWPRWDRGRGVGSMSPVFTASSAILVTITKRLHVI